MFDRFFTPDEPKDAPGVSQVIDYNSDGKTTRRVHHRTSDGRFYESDWYDSLRRFLYIPADVRAMPNVLSWVFTSAGAFWLAKASVTWLVLSETQLLWLSASIVAPIVIIMAMALNRMPPWVVLARLACIVTGALIVL